jgi:hypothetical protein
MDLFVAYKLQKNVEKILKEERDREKGKTMIPVKTEPKIVKTDCHNCGQNWLWCICDHSILNEG